MCYIVLVLNLELYFYIKSLAPSIVFSFIRSAILLFYALGLHVPTTDPRGRLYSPHSLSLPPSLYCHVTLSYTYLLLYIIVNVFFLCMFLSITNSHVYSHWFQSADELMATFMGLLVLLFLFFTYSYIRR